MVIEVPQTPQGALVLELPIKLVLHELEHIWSPESFHHSSAWKVAPEPEAGVEVRERLRRFQMGCPEMREHGLLVEAPVLRRGCPITRHGDKMFGMDPDLVKKNPRLESTLFWSPAGDVHLRGHGVVVVIVAYHDPTATIDWHKPFMF